jgi:pimeloyl-ACP methyl ester carboxylesterase
MDISLEFIATNGIKLHTAFAGPADGEPVILLHGYPDAWFGWEQQIKSLAEAGYRVIAPDQRGYNLSDKPGGIDSYNLKVLAADIVGLADTLGIKKFYLAGHDFGGIVSWSIASLFPDRLKKLVIINVPHPRVMLKYVRTHPSQMRRSWYAYFFRLPWLPEKVVSAGNYNLLMSSMARGLSTGQRERYLEAWRQPGATTSMINWYRSMLAGGASMPFFKNPITAPVLVIWGKQDPHIEYQMAQLSADYCRDGRVVMIEDATHWVMVDKPDEAGRLIIEHFSKA